MTMITPSYLGETIEYSSLHACRSTLEDPTYRRMVHRPNLSSATSSVFVVPSPSARATYPMAASAA